MKEETVGKIFITLIIVVVVVMAAFAIISTPVDTEETQRTHQWDVWSCDAPFGTYWTEASGGGCFLYYSMDSSLMESYTVKYLEGDVLKTQIFASTDPYFIVHLTDENSMTLERYQHIYENYLGEETLRGPTTYHLYIPDPNTMEE